MCRPIACPVAVLAALLCVTAQAQPAQSGGAVSLRAAQGPDAVELVAENRYFGPAQVAIYRRGDGVTEDVRLVGRLRMLPARSATALWPLADGDSVEAYFEQHLPGDPAASHAPAGPYRLPYPIGSAYAISQSYPERITHRDRSSEYAIDFEMPIGTPVHAARSGIVMEVAGDYYGEDSVAASELPANLIRVLHDDGTMALYAHLQWNTIRVAPGEQVERGEWIASSGNTGFSTGPHLHFAVQRNRGGLLVSLPVEFAGRDGVLASLTSGDTPTAY